MSQRDMKCLQLLFVCWCSSILAVTSCIRADGFSCVTAYWNTITCVLNITGNPVGQSNTTYSLKFTLKSKNLRGDQFSCPVVVKNHSYSCDCKVNSCTSFHQYDIELCHESGCHPVTNTPFEPSQNIQLTPPHKPEVRKSPETFNITWNSGYESHRHLASALDYELLLQTSQSTESKILHVSSQETYWIQRSQLKPSATYCIKVRSKPKENLDYKGTWSKWSPLTCWKNEAEEAFSEQENTDILVILTKSLGPVCVALGLLLFVFCSPAARMKIKTLSHTPSPAPFFQPLFQQHEGNLKEWLSPQGKYLLTYKTEKILTTDAVIVVPKPITKDPEENQDFHNPSVTQLALPQCQTSYVGLPGIHEASPPLTMVCPGDTSYTQLPCSVWGVAVGEVEVVSSPPKDFFNISHVDSGCSCEDITQSPECSLPNSPVDDSPTLCYCNDYCILNKTAEGFAPVIVSKGGRLDVPSAET
ncbi:interleukin-21 receptor-like [Siniperca chuatsi]|uniref:interleukin-21 receptor-like n=1 Tax=Siniperca chuatsi TaxID=119488 RepID=UPI001CE13B8C|nr:interleukin-21 receptor-like [Siniperca chuatsi]